MSDLIQKLIAAPDVILNSVFWIGFAWGVASAFPPLHFFYAWLYNPHKVEAKEVRDAAQRIRDAIEKMKSVMDGRVKPDFDVKFESDFIVLAIKAVDDAKFEIIPDLQFFGKITRWRIIKAMNAAKCSTGIQECAKRLHKIYSLVELL